MAMAQTAFRTRPAFNRHHTAVASQSQRAEMPLFQAFLRPSSSKVTDGLCIKDATTIDFACGTGGFLIDAVEHLRKQRNKAEDNAIIEKTVFGVEKNSSPICCVQPICCSMMWITHASIMKIPS